MTDKWIGNSKPWKPLNLNQYTQTPEGLTAMAEEMQATFDLVLLKKAAGRANKVEMPDILPKEPQWRPTDGEAFGGLEYGDWPGYLHADDFRP